MLSFQIYFLYDACFVFNSNDIIPSLSLKVFSLSLITITCVKFLDYLECSSVFLKACFPNLSFSRIAHELARFVISNPNEEELPSFLLFFLTSEFLCTWKIWAQLSLDLFLSRKLLFTQHVLLIPNQTWKCPRVSYLTLVLNLRDLTYASVNLCVS